MKIEIKKAENGFVTVVNIANRDKTRIHDTLQAAIQSVGRDALMYFEGRGHTFTGSRYGVVSVEVFRDPIVEMSKECQQSNQ